MVMTVEPGIYIPAGTARRAEALLEHRHPHRGRRAVVDGAGCEILTDDVPSEPEDIEAAMAAAREVDVAPMSSCRFDIAIVGGGLVGASLAVALRGQRACRIALVEAFAPDSAAQPSFDERTTALGNASRRMFEALGVWQAMRAGRRAHHRHPCVRRGPLRLRAAGRQDSAWMRWATWCPTACWAARCGRRCSRAIRTSRLHARARACNRWRRCRWRSSHWQSSPARVAATIAARLVVAADGAAFAGARGCWASPRPSTTTHQVAVVASLRTDQPNDGMAYERFTPAGPMALLPLRGAEQHGWRTLVWAAPPGRRRRLMALRCADSSCANGRRHFGWRAGRALRLGARARYPLALYAQRGRWRRASCCWAMPRRRCIRWRGRASTSGCVMRPSWPSCCSWHPIGPADPGSC